MKKNTQLLLILFSISLLVITCSDSEKKKLEDKTDPRLELVGAYKLNIREPSGLTLSSDGEYLWTVSDESNRLYKITRQGEVIDSFHVSGFDLEGIDAMDDDNLLIVTERDRGVLMYSPDFQLKKRVLLHISDEENSGIEGIVHNPKNGTTYIINEKKPGLLVEINDQFNIIKRTELKFAKDYSGLEIDTAKNRLWIISDENQLLVNCDMEGNPVDSYKVDIPQIEGIAIDFEDKLIYIVSDNTEYLYVFRLKEE
jgi:uncharacterized protein YjiK